MPLVEPLSGFVDATSRDAGVSTSVALGQVYAPTGYPGRLTIVPGVVITQPAKYDYAPDIVVAERKVRASFAAARAGRVAVVNIHVEPGAGKTLHLPRKFTDSKCLVVLPTVFDTWSAWSNRPQDTGIEVYGYSKPAQGPVTYTDSYHAAWMLVNGRIGDYSVVFVDESDSDTGLTPFLSEAARGGVVFVRMTASPQTSVGRPTFSFPVAEEHDVPDQSDIQASARYVDRKRKDRTLVLCSTADVAEALVSLVPGCSLLTVRTPLDQLERLFDDIVSPITLVADSVSGRGVNLNIDCTIDFGLVTDSNGLERQITFSERLQRRGRVGRSKPGVYCCAFAGTTTRQLDQTAVFRNNLWRQVVGGRLAPCGFQCPTDPKRVHELIASIAGDIEEDPNLAVPARASVAPSSDGGRTVFSGDGERTRRMYCSVVVDEDESFSGLNEEKSFNPARVDWYGYYTASTNHPSRYVADLVFDHRQVNVASIQLDRQVAIKRADNRVFDPESPKLVHRNPESRVASGLGGYGNQGTVVKSESRRGSDTLSVAPDLGQARGTVAYDVSPYDSRSLGPVGVRDLGGDFAAADGPLVLMRASKVSRYSRGTAYTAASVCHGFFTVYGLVLASGNDLHPALRPIDPSARDSLRAFTGSAGAVDAEYMLTYVTTIPVRDVNVADKRGMLTRRGAWSIPTCCTVPTIDISGDDYHADWDEVISERIKGKLPLPMFVPRNAPRATTRYRYVNTSKLEHAMEVCEDPTYNADEQAVVYSAWDQLAVESCVLSGRRLNLFPAAAALLSYMVRADRLNNRGTPRVEAGGFQGQSRHAY